MSFKTKHLCVVYILAWLYQEVSVIAGNIGVKSSSVCTSGSIQSGSCNIANEELQEYVIFVGNPGVGKSTLLNSLFGEVKFRAGFSISIGLTKVLQLVNHQGIYYGDTPGLSDVKMRKQAALEIEKALKQNGKYKLIFVLTVEGGRLRPDDLSTMKVVLESIDDESFPFAVVINKATNRLIRELATNATKLKEFMVTLNYDHRATANIFLYPLNDELIDEDNRLAQADPKFVKFLQMLPSKEVFPDKVKHIKIDDFDRLKQDHQTKIKDLLADNLRLQNEFEKQKEEIRKNKIYRIIAGVLTLGMTELFDKLFG